MMFEEILTASSWLLFAMMLAIWRTLPIFILVSLMDVCSFRKMPPRFLVLLWAIVLVRLCMPFSIPNAFALQGPWDQAGATVLATGDALWNSSSPGNAQESTAIDPSSFSLKSESNGMTDRLPVIDSSVNSHSLLNNNPSVNGVAAIAPLSETSSADGRKNHSINSSLSVSGSSLSVSGSPQASTDGAAVVTTLVLLCIAVWGLGAAYLTIRSMAQHLSFSRRLRRLPQIDDPSVLNQWAMLCRDAGIHPPCVKVVNCLATPAVFGFRKPTLCLPVDWKTQINQQEMGWVMKHEIAHVKRRDALLLCFASLVRSIHWINPIAWIATHKLRTHIERAADQYALDGAEEHQRLGYGNLLIRCAAQTNASASTIETSAMGSLLCMASTRNLASRLESLSGTFGTTRKFKIASLMLLFFLATSGLSDAQSPPKPNDQGEAPSMWKPLPKWDEPLVMEDARSTSPSRQVVSIDVRDHLEKIRGLSKSEDAEKILVTYFVPASQWATAKVDKGILSVQLSKKEEYQLKDQLDGLSAGLWQVAVSTSVMDVDVKWLYDIDWVSGSDQTKLRRLSALPEQTDVEAWRQLLKGVEANSNASENDQRQIRSTSSLPLLTSSVSAEKFDWLMERCLADEHSETREMPRVTLFNGQMGHVVDAVRRPFVTNVEQRKLGKAVAFQPQISIFDSGWRLCVQTKATSNQHLDLGCVISHASIEGLRLASLPFRPTDDPESRVTIQVPTVLTDGIVVKSQGHKSDEILLVYSPLPYEENDTESPSVGRVFAFRFELIPDSFEVESKVDDSSKSK